MRHITIIGGGIGGLCLAQGLKKANLNFSIYERNASADSWLEGYRIHIRPVGTKSLYSCLPGHIWMDFLACTAAPTDGFGFLTEDMQELVHIEEQLMTAPGKLLQEGQYNVSRKLLREVLITGLENDIHYGKTFQRYEVQPDKKVKVYFDDATVIETDVLVGADGANSKVRQQLLPYARRVETNAVAIGGKMYFEKDTAQWLPECIRSRMNVVMPKNKYFFFNAVYRRKEENYILWSFIAHANEFKATPAMSELKKTVAEKINSWHPAFTKLVLHSDDASLLWLPLKTMQPVQPWESGPVTLLGDAIHNMTPLQGMGANMALYDAALLSQKLEQVAAGNQPLKTAINEYESNMLKTGFKAVKDSLKYTKQAISGNRLCRLVSRTWFRICNAVPSIKRMTFGSRYQ
jgi:2-polyprenyl-6-methoxyphenol hydroxylase-like FAD-dependent oxidoreductase